MPTFIYFGNLSTTNQNTFMPTCVPIKFTKCKPKRQQTKYGNNSISTVCSVTHNPRLRCYEVHQNEGTCLLLVFLDIDNNFQKIIKMKGIILYSIVKFDCLD